MTNQADRVDYPNADPRVLGVLAYMEATEQELTRKRKQVKREKP